MSIINKWGALSMSDRAFLIREAVRNGITDIDSIRDTWEHRFDGESNQPTEDEYIAQRAKEKIVEALMSARNRKETIQPYVEKSQKYKEDELEKLQMFEAKLDDLYRKADLTSKMNLSYDKLGIPKITKVIDPNIQERIHRVQDYVNKYKLECSKSHTHGPGCLATVMDDYGKTETWNKRFAQDPRKHGFIEVDQKDILPGDIVQFGDYYRDTKTGAKTEWEPVHAMMANTPYHEMPKAVKYNGSDGGADVRINSSYPVDSWEDNTKAFRFVGDKADSLQWKKEYREKYGHQFSGEENAQPGTYISKKPKNNIKTGNVKFNLLDFDTWKYRKTPTYSKDTDFTLAFTDALLDGEKNFKWGDNYYSTKVDYDKKFTMKEGKKPFEEFADYMYPAVIQVLQENKMPVDMAHNVVRQAAMESDYGLSPRGEHGFNLSGIKWTKKAGEAGYKYTEGEDGEKYIDFKDLKEYINYKVHTLNNNYGALNASNVHDYVEALHPKAFNKTPRSKNYKGDYSGGAKNYQKSMTGMSSLDKTLMDELYFPLFRK